MSDSDGTLEIKWKGPKEWRPVRWPGSPLLSAEENRKIGLIIGESKRAVPKVTPEDVTWLCGIIRRTATLSPDDYAFPPYLALINQIKCEAYATRYEETLLIENTVTLRKDVAPLLLEHTTFDQPHDATVLIRPYIQLNHSSDPEAVLWLRNCTLSMKVDEVEVLRTPVDEHLIFGDGSFPRKNRWKVRGLNPQLFIANLIGKDQSVNPDEREGIFCANGSQILMYLWGNPALTGDVTVTAGLVAARYTTKGYGDERDLPRTL